MFKKAQYNRNRPKQAYKLALLGATDQEIADFMEINIHTLTYWKRTKPDFKRRLDKGKAAADANVAKALYRRAIGYEHPEDHISVYKGEVVVVPTIKHYPPDTKAAMRWLSLRQRDKWAEIQRSEKTINIVNSLDLSGFTSEELETLKKAGLRNVAVNQLKENVGSN